MLGDRLGDIEVGGTSRTGEAVGITAIQGALTGIFVAWNYNGFYGADDIVFLVYVDGILKAQTNGLARSANLITTNFGAHDIQVVAWPTWLQISRENYGAVAATRAHLVWIPSNDLDIGGYQVYISSDGGTVYTLYATHDKPSVATGVYEMGAAATCLIDGEYAGSIHKNTTFTLTVTSAALRTFSLTNNLNADVVNGQYSLNSVTKLFAGVTATIGGSPADSDSIDFLVGVLPKFDSGELETGTYWFKIAELDNAGNERNVSADTAVEVAITAPPEPVASFVVEFAVSGSTVNLNMHGKQSPSTDAALVRIYANYDADFNELIDDFQMFTELAALQSANFQTLIAAAGMPDGDYKFYAVCVNSGGIEDATANPKAITLPYQANLPTPVSLAATSMPAGEVRITWYTPKLFSGTWTITQGASSETITPSASRLAGMVRYTTVLNYAFFGSADGDYTVEVVAVSGTFSGDSASCTATSDSTAPGAVTGLIATPF